ncbi:hypothetical protein [Nguyenibacter vanlangensis]|uniref:NIPSNAP protein n=1 Tax=Nguyenibacter vanlangensis TaxID=1216886 RepID=A0A7Y7IVJ2_9PROT|nr:hypothetical protein [Nguyenibacter vanlangensis]NVN11135.1 hypothetical protein [Nguyenibacter vanlangensis]
MSWIFRMRALACVAGLAASAASLAMWSAVSSARADEIHQDGPTTLAIFYRAKPADRPAFRRYLLDRELDRLAAWKKGGVLKNYQILYNPYVDSETWDAATLLEFPSYAQVGQWQAIEQTAPGGLDAAGLALARPVQTYSLDLRWTEGSGDPNRGIYYIINYTVGNDENWKKWDVSFKGYGLPQMHGWIRDKALISYRMYTNRYDSGDRWDELLLLQYRDLAALGQRDAEMAKVRAELARDPNFKPLIDHVHAFHTEGNDVLGVPLVK